MAVSFNDGEYRVAYPLKHYDAPCIVSRGLQAVAQEKQAYYTDDALDAYSTAIVMSKALIKEAA
jgi:hypothetical protein